MKAEYKTKLPLSLEPRFLQDVQKMAEKSCQS